MLTSLCLSLHETLYTNSTTPLLHQCPRWKLKCPEIGGSHPFICWMHRNSTQYIFFDIQFTNWLQDCNCNQCPTLICKSGSQQRARYSKPSSDLCITKKIECWSIPLYHTNQFCCISNVNQVLILHTHSPPPPTHTHTNQNNIPANSINNAPIFGLILIAALRKWNADAYCCMVMWTRPRLCLIFQSKGARYAALFKQLIAYHTKEQIKTIMIILWTWVWN